MRTDVMTFNFVPPTPVVTVTETCVTLIRSSGSLFVCFLLFKSFLCFFLTGFQYCLPSRTFLSRALCRFSCLLRLLLSEPLCRFLGSLVPLSLLSCLLLVSSFVGSFSGKPFHVRLSSLLSRYSFLFLSLSLRELLFELFQLCFGFI